MSVGRRGAFVPIERSLLVASFILLLVGCAARPLPLPATYRQPSTVFFVAHSPGDDTAMEEEIAVELRRRGFEASAGPYETLPAEAGVLVLYRDSWWLNLLAQGEILVLELRDTRTGATIASAEQRWISYVGDVPETLVREAVGQLLGDGTGGP